MAIDISQCLDEYQCHKKVRAARIVEIFPLAGGDYLLIFESANHPGPVYHQVSAEWWDKHQPEKHGYFVEYNDGYQSYSPAQAFEEGYRLIRPINVTQG